MRFLKPILAVYLMLVVATGSAQADTLTGLADVTVADGAIVSLRVDGTEYVVADNDLILGTTSRWYIPADSNEAVLWAEGDPAPEATVSDTSDPKEGDVGSKADNFQFALEGSTNLSSIDGNVDQIGRCRQIVVPNFMMSCLKIPNQLTGVGI